MSSSLQGIAKLHRTKRDSSLDRIPKRNRRLVLEMLEDRRVLSVLGLAPELPGMQLVDPNTANLGGQVIYLDYDGEAAVTFNGPVALGPFDIPAFVAPGELGGQEDAVMASVTERLNALFAPVEVTFTLDRPEQANYSTIHIGGDGDWASSYGTFLGLAEQVDVGNLDPADRAFVFSGALEVLNGGTEAYVDSLFDIVAHETAHLLGYVHAEAYCVASAFEDGLLGEQAPSAESVVMPLGLEGEEGGTDVGNVASVANTPQRADLDGVDLTYLAQTPSITVTSPNGGQAWKPGATQQITWSSVGSTGTHVKIELLKGGTLNRTISASTANNGSFFWTIPEDQPVGSDFKVRITSTSNPSYFDLSNGNFSIVASINITSPNGVHEWQRGTTQLITWNSVGNTGAYVKIELYKGGAFARLITASTPNGTADDRSFNWTIPANQLVGTDYKVRITSTSNASYSAVSDRDFSIVPAPTFTVTSPNSTQRWQRGRSHQITWDSIGNPGANVKIELHKGGVFHSTITNSTANNGSFTWLIPIAQAGGTDYKVKITSTSNAAYTALSAGEFWILANPLITVTSPNGGQQRQRGTVLPITWSSDGDAGAHVKIELYKNGAYNRIITASTANNGSFNWTIPADQLVGADYKIRITSTSNSSYSDASDGDFSIVAVPVMPAS
ncbi:MAG: Ser-Thr-rich GPI-anchored membrane family protein, partial [Patescibacteria group bacterium]|nr:Ser-Thr-rich GPI-anchored membrane family protein [Patescibacteria group bacterium]